MIKVVINRDGKMDDGKCTSQLKLTNLTYTNVNCKWKAVQNRRGKISFKSLFFLNLAGFDLYYYIILKNALFSKESGEGGGVGS